MNSATAGKAVMDASLNALRAKYKNRVRRYGNILVGFSEGAFVAMQAGLMDQKTWSRWLILAASDRYWVGEAPAALTAGSGGGKLQRVFLLTGETDGVAENTSRVGEMLKKYNVPVKVRIAPGMGHEIARDRGWPWGTRLLGARGIPSRSPFGSILRGLLARAFPPRAPRAPSKPRPGGNSCKAKCLCETWSVTQRVRAPSSKGKAAGWKRVLRDRRQHTGNRDHEA
jgi:hypothetical protein